jgi:aldose sugar dehydrogenase
LVNPNLILDLPSEPGFAHNGGAITIGPDNN